MVLVKKFHFHTTACEWVETKDKNSPQGRLMGNYNSRLDCQNACFAASDTEKCKYGYDYQEGAQNGFKCYFSVSKTLTDFPGVNHWNPRCEGRSTIQITNLHFYTFSNII